MKVLAVVVLYFFALSAYANQAKIPHLELELSSYEYADLLNKRAQTFGIDEQGTEPLANVITFGKRNLDWLIFMNAHRPADTQLSFSTPENTKAYPIDAPGESNEMLVLKEYQDLLKDLPVEMKAILVHGNSFTEQPPIAEVEYLNWGLRVDRAYQRASRWILQRPYLESYASRQKKDIRGYYFLSKVEGLADKLKNFSSLSDADKVNFTAWLLGMCGNMWNTTSAFCKQKLNQAIAAKTVDVYYANYLQNSKGIFDAYFAIPSTRPEAEWNPKNPNLMVLPFLNPDRKDVLDFLQVNIEDEWRWKDWSFHLNFIPNNGEDLVHVEFEAGSTPHVNGLAGNTITIDGNAPLTEYAVRWTIRHEFGHVLGFPDCYVEFYDKDSGKMINYQIDTTNLMCSRKGKFKEEHFSELQRAYFR